jgi:hypothetical protein
MHKSNVSMLGGDCWYVNLPGEIGAMALHAFAGRMIRLRSAWGASGPRKGQKPTSSKFSFANLLSARRADNGRFIRKEVAMTTDPPEPPRPLPDRPNLRHLKNQAKDLLKSGGAHSLTDAQFQIARLYGFSSWPKLKAHVESEEEIALLKQAIDANDFDKVKSLMTRNPALHRAPLGYTKNGPLTWVAFTVIARGEPIFPNTRKMSGFATCNPTSGQ